MAISGIKNALKGGRFLIVLRYMFCSGTDMVIRSEHRPTVFFHRFLSLFVQLLVIKCTAQLHLSNTSRAFQIP